MRKQNNSYYPKVNDIIMKIINIFNKFFDFYRLIKIHGLKKLYKRVIRKTSLYDSYYNYWISKFEDKYDYIDVKKRISNFNKKPLISVITPIYNTNIVYLKECINSVLNQYYKNWELILVDNKSNHEIFNFLKKINNKKIKIQFLRKNYGISYATNIGILKAKGEYVALLDHDDLLKPEALYEIVKIINYSNKVDLVYSDEDKIITDINTRVQPFFKSCWGKDSLLSYMFINHLCVFKRKISLQIGGFNPFYDGSQDYEFMLRFTEKTNHIHHCSKILYHWRISDSSTSKNTENKSYAYDKFVDAKKNFLNKKNDYYKLQLNKETYSTTLIYKDISYKLNKITIIIIKTKKDLCLLRNTLNKLEQEINNNLIYLVINSLLINKYLDNNCKNLLKNKKTFLYKKNLIAILNKIIFENKKSHIIILISPFLKILNLKNALNHAMKEHVGVVTGNIIDTKKRIISSGILMLNNLKTPLAAYNDISFNNTNVVKDISIIKNTFAAPKEFMVFSTKKILSVNGFDLKYIEDDYFDIDVCCKFLKRRLYNVCRGDLIIYINNDEFKYSNKEFLNKKNYNNKIFHHKWDRTFLEKYNFYNQNLSQKRADFSIKI